ncbi:UDP-glucuronosyltransferase [Blattella germanica]|nr:UDP-glucuronosyltransferase [Blattella germanica]
MGLVQDFYNLPRQDAVMRKYFTDTDDLPLIQDLIYNTSLLLVNNHYITNYPKPMVPNFIQELKKFIDEAPDGVIYFSLGTLLKSSNMPESKIQSFLKAFSKLKQRVLWKWETDSLPGQPNNVKLGKWLPQSDILDDYILFQLIQTYGYSLHTAGCIACRRQFITEYRYWESPYLQINQ